jgi:molybdate transport system regulatory protein
MSDTTQSSSSASLLQALGHPLSDRRLQVLRALGECGSISQAARHVGVSYKAAWQAIDTLGNLAGVPVVEKSVGGAGGGGATLTAAGHELLRAASAMVLARETVLQQLHTPTQVPQLGLQTSMRNQWPGTVHHVQVAGPLALVQVLSAHSDVPLQARITAESAELLALQPGLPVLVLCKATAVQVRVSTAALPATNTVLGKVSRVTAGALGDEVSVQMSEGLHWVGFAPTGSGLRTGRKVQVHVPPEALVLALMQG